MENGAIALGLHEWLSTFAFSRTVKHAPRDFSDAVLMAELLCQLLPAGAVAIHNYPPTGRLQQKLINWDILNRKVLTPMRCEISRKNQEDLASAVPGAIALLLIQVKKASDRPMTRSPGKPPRSPSKKPNPSAHMSIPPEEAYWMAPHLVPEPDTTPAFDQKAAKRTVLRSGANNTNRNTASASKSTTKSPSSRACLPRQNLPSQHARGGSRSSYSLLDVLPLASGPPDPDAMTGSFARVLQMTDTGGGRSQRSSTSSGRRGRRDNDKQISTHVRVKDASSLVSSSGARCRKMLSTQRASAGTCNGDLLGQASLTPLATNVRAQTQASDIPIGSFVTTVSGLSGEEDSDVQIARIDTLQSGDYVIQLFKPCVSNETQEASSVTSEPSQFVSTTQFIECCSSHLQPLGGVMFDEVTSLLTCKKHHQVASSHCRVWPASPAQSVAAPFEYATAALARIQCTSVSLNESMKLCSVQSPVGSTSPLQVPPPLPFHLDASQLDLCPPPTVFPRVPVDMDAILTSLPPKYPSSRTIKRQV